MTACFRAQARAAYLAEADVGELYTPRNLELFDPPAPAAELPAAGPRKQQPRAMTSVYLQADSACAMRRDRYLHEAGDVGGRERVECAYSAAS